VSLAGVGKLTEAADPDGRSEFSCVSGICVVKFAYLNRINILSISFGGEPGSLHGRVSGARGFPGRRRTHWQELTQMQQGNSLATALLLDSRTFDR
jgi:hypothetical protein